MGLLGKPTWQGPLLRRARARCWSASPQKKQAQKMTIFWDQFLSIYQNLWGWNGIWWKCFNIIQIGKAGFFWGYLKFCTIKESKDPAKPCLGPAWGSCRPKRDVDEKSPCFNLVPEKLSHKIAWLVLIWWKKCKNTTICFGIWCPKPNWKSYFWSILWDLLRKSESQ